MSFVNMSDQIGVRNVIPSMYEDPDAYTIRTVTPNAAEPMPTVSPFTARQAQGQVAQAQLASYAPAAKAGSFTPEEIAWAKQNIPNTEPTFTPEEIQWAKQNYPEEKANTTVPDSSNSFTDFIIASGNEVGSNIAGALKNIGKIVGSDTLTQFGETRQKALDADIDAAIKSSPTVGTTGKYITDIAMLLGAGGGASIPGLMLGGAASGLASSTKANPLKDVATSAIAGGVVGAGLNLAKGLVPVSKGQALQLKFWDTDSFVNNAIQATAQKHGGDITKASPADFVTTALADLKASKSTANALYNTRDTIAKNQGTFVKRDSLKEYLNTLSKDIEVSSTPDMKQALAAGQGLMGDGKEVSFSLAYDRVKRLGRYQNDAYRNNNTDLSNLYAGMKTALLDDINKSAVGPELKQANAIANNYYANIHSKIRDLGISEEAAKQFTETQYMARIGKALMQQSEGRNALKTIDPTVMGKYMASQMQAVKEATLVKTPGGADNIDLTPYAKALTKNAQQFKGVEKGLYEDMATLAKTIATRAEAGKFVPSGIEGRLTAALATGAGTLGVGTGVLNPYFLGAAVLPKTYYLYKAGKMLENPSVSNLLKSMRSLEGRENTPMFKLITERIGNIFSRTK